MNPMVFPVSVMLAAALFQPVRLGAAAEDAPVRGLIQRLLPGHASNFTVEFIPADHGQDVFEIESQEGRIVLRGNNGVSVASALNWSCSAGSRPTSSTTWRR